MGWPMTNTNLESDLKGLTRQVNRDGVDENDFMKNSGQQIH